MTAKAAILKALASGPKTPAELREAAGDERKCLSNCIKALLRNKQISRVKISVGRFKYYIGQTAPGWDGYQPENKKLEPQTNHHMPVKRIEFAADCGRTNRVTIPALPWEAHA